MKRVIIFKKYSWAVLIALILFKIFFVWFKSPEIIGGDWPYYSTEFLHAQRIFPSIWSTYRGLAGAVSPVMNLETFQSFLVVPWVNWFGLSWNIVYKIGWFGLFLILGIISSLTLSKVIFIGKDRHWAHAMSVLIFVTNTYILMILSGGQMGVALAYSLFPLILAQFIKLGNYVFFDNKFEISEVLWTGLFLSMEIIFDMRIVYLSAIAVFVYWLFIICWQLFRRDIHVKDIRWNFRFVALSVIVPVMLAILLNAFWLLPTFATLSRTVGELGAIYTFQSSVSFFSFADLSHALSLLHPNWPENIFGKTYFLQPEFLILPILAFSSLILVVRTKNKKIYLIPVCFFSLLALIGTFFAKGANEPFGNLYLWLFNHVPGFVMFRDPTKWYVFITTSFAILIPASIEMIVDVLKGKLTSNASLIGTSVRLLTVILWVVFIRQALFGSLGGTLQIHNIPKEYTELANNFSHQTDYFRTLWIPKQPRFSPVSYLHPSLSSDYIITASSAAGFIEQFDTPIMKNYLEELSVKYVVIPSDPLGEIFLVDRRYDPRLRAEWENYIDSVPWLNKISSGNITIYETRMRRDHFWVPSGNIGGYHMLSPDSYNVSLATRTPVVLYFSEGFNPGWQVRIENQTIGSRKTSSGLNSFALPYGVTGDLHVFFYPEIYAVWGRGVSMTTLVSIVIFVILQSNQKGRKHYE